MRDQISTIGQSKPRSYIYINVADVFKYNLSFALDFLIFQDQHNICIISVKKIFASTRQQPRFSTCI
jgi:hypothetical protein